MLMKLIKKKRQYHIWSLLLLWLVGTAFVQAQSQTVTGTTSDSNGPLPGVNVVVKGTTNGTTSDFDGNFTINNVPDGATLVFSYLGYKTQEAPVSGGTVSITMEEDAEYLDEVVVVGYGSQKKSDLTGAVGVVDNKEIEKYTFSDASQALQGRVAGVNVQSAGGAPGAGANITVRGLGSLTDASPLFVIDGVITGGMSSINSSDIESISVLKDASATAIYGSRAANGVIIITSKKGVRGKVSIDFDTSIGFQKLIKSLDWANARQYADIVNQANDNDGVTRAPANDSEFNPNLTSNLYDESIRTATIKNTNFRISGGGENTLYSFSVGHQENEGIVKYSDFTLSTARSNVSFTKGKFKLNNTIGLTRSVNNPNPYFNKERNLPPTISLKDENGDWVHTNVDASSAGAFYGQSSRINELGFAALEDRTITRNTVLGNLTASYEILNGLTYKISLGAEYYADNNYKFTPDHPVITGTGGNIITSELSETNTNYLSTLVEQTLNYKRSFGNHNIDLLGGITQQKDNLRSLGTKALDFPSNNIRIASQAETLQSAPSRDLTSAIQSYFGRLNYNYDDRYLLTATLRRDGSSLFIGDLRWGTFPSFALGWNISNEKFLENFDALTNIKFRASYGEIGSSNVPIYAVDPEINLFSEYILGVNQGRVTGYSITKGVDPSIFWETTKTTDIGLEFSALNNKLNVTMDYFIKKSEDVLGPVPPPFYSGYQSAIPQNTASVDNKGFEFSASYANQIGDLSYNVSGNFSVLDNEVTSLGGATPRAAGSFTSNTTNSTLTDVGQPIGSFYGYIVDGIYQTDAEAAAANDATGNPRAGDFRFKDIAGPDNSGPDGIIDVNDQTFLGSPIPTFEYSLNLSADYKNFDLSLYFNGVSGNSIVNGVKYRGYFDNDGNYFADALNAWTPSNTNTSVARNTQSDPGKNKRMSSFYVEDGAYFRLRNAQIGYSLPDNVLDKIKLSKVRLYLSAINLFTITDYSGYYPEVGRNARGNGDQRSSIYNAGVDEGAYPTPRTYQLGLQVSF